MISGEEGREGATAGGRRPQRRLPTRSCARQPQVEGRGERVGGMGVEGGRSPARRLTGCSYPSSAAAVDDQRESHNRQARHSSTTAQRRHLRSTLPQTQPREMRRCDGGVGGVGTEKRMMRGVMGVQMGVLRWVGEGWRVGAETSLTFRGGCPPAHADCAVSALLCHWYSCGVADGGLRWKLKEERRRWADGLSCGCRWSGEAERLSG